MKHLIISILLLATPLLSRAASSYVNTYNVNGINRSAVIYAPDNIEKGRPLLISLHGRWGSGKDQQKCANFESIADTAKFVVVYPDGLPQPVIGGNTGWDANGDTDNDIAFFKAVIDSMAEKYGINRKRVYICGFSLGGMMTYHCANAASDIFAAFASCSGYPLNEYKKVYTSKRPIPFMHIHGKADGFVTYGNLQPVIDNWIMRGGCNPIPEVEEKTGVYTKRYYAGTKGGFDFLYYSLDGIGHEYRNSDYFNTSREICNFVSRYSLDDSYDENLKWNPQLQMRALDTLPVGWNIKEDNVNTDFTGTDNTHSRIRKITEGGDFSCGFYLKSGLSSGQLTYGDNNDYSLQVKAGKYRLNFNSIAWKNVDSKKAIVLSVVDKNSNSIIKTVQVIPDVALTDNKAEGSCATSVDFDISKDTQIVLNWSIDGQNTEMLISNLVFRSLQDVASIVNVNSFKDSSHDFVYDLSGRVVSESSTGLLIKNNKVVYVRK